MNIIIILILVVIFILKDVIIHLILLKEVKVVLKIYLLQKSHLNNLNNMCYITDLKLVIDLLNKNIVKLLKKKS